jgi:nitrogenase molybdenum-iron protein alpha chain
MKSFKRMRDPGAEGLVFLNTNLSESEVIGGGEGKLASAILYADEEFRPELILVAIGCVPSLIGDDVDAVAEKLKNVVSATIVPIHCAGFKTSVMATAYDDVYHGVLSKIVRAKKFPDKVLPNDEEEVRFKIVKNRTVNVLNVTSMSRSDELELQRLINSLDLDARFVVCYGNQNNISDSLESALNVSICGTHDDYFLEHLATIYKIPFILDTMPIGPRNNARWLYSIADFFGKREAAEQLLSDEEDSLERAVGPLREEFKGKTAFLAGGELRVVVTAELLRYLGLGIVGIKGHHFDKFILPAMEQLDNAEELVFHIATQQPFEHVNVAKRLNPDVFVGHSGGNNLTAKLGLPILPLFSNAAGYMGYAGAFEVARRLKRILSNSAFNSNLAKHCQLPFRQSWYKKDPFSYIKPEGREKVSEASCRNHQGQLRKNCVNLAGGGV